jgi:hypothetical protein
MKLSKLLKLIPYYNSQKEIEMLLYECNREDFVHTMINYHSSDEGFLSFNKEAQVAERLVALGDQLNTAFHRVAEATTHGKSKRHSIFMKVKEKLEEEIQEKKREW